MNNKGFTLTELIVTIAIMSIILGISFPAISKLQTENRKTVYETYSNVLINGAKLYVDKYNRDLFDKKNSESQCVSISYNDLVNEKLIKEYNSRKKNEVIITDNNITYVNATKINDSISYDVALTIMQNDKVVYEKKLDKLCEHINLN